MFSRKIQSLCIALFCLCAAVPQMARAEYPEHPVTVYHPFEPTPYDALSKVYNAEMSKLLGVPFVFEYGMMGIAAQATLNGRPDGYTVYFAAMGPMVLKPNWPVRFAQGFPGGGARDPAADPVRGEQECAL